MLDKIHIRQVRGFCGTSSTRK